MQLKINIKTLRWATIPKKYNFQGGDKDYSAQGQFQSVWGESERAQSGVMNSLKKTCIDHDDL